MLASRAGDGQIKPAIGHTTIHAAHAIARLDRAIAFDRGDELLPLARPGVVGQGDPAVGHLQEPRTAPGARPVIGPDQPHGAAIPPVDTGWRTRCRLQGDPLFRTSGQRHTGTEQQRPDQPTISVPAKKYAISRAAEAGLSEPWTELASMFSANSLRIVPGSALAGLVAPMTLR